jgi:probable HAF family extracellular repeat protein
MSAVLRPRSYPPFPVADLPAAPAPRAYTISALGLHLDGSPLLPVALNDAGDIAVCTPGHAPSDAMRGFFLTGMLRVPAGVATGHQPVMCVSSSGLTAGASGAGPRELRAWASHVGVFGDDLWPDSISVARGINAQGLVVGNVLFDAGDFTLSRAFVLTPPGFAKFLVPPQGGTTFVTGINDAGDVIFNATPLGSAPEETHAWCLHQNSYIAITSLGGGRSWASAITPSGLIVGHALDEDGAIRAFLWADGETRDLGTYADCASEALGAHDQRTVVGRVIARDGGRRAFRWTPEDRLTLLEDLVDGRQGWELQEALSVNAAGRIVGTGRLHGQTRGFMLTPIT